MPDEKTEQTQKTLEAILQLLQSQSEQESDTYRLILFLIPIFGIVFGSTLLWFVFYWWHKQRITLIREGLYKHTPFDIRAYSFLIGLLLTFIGLALSIVFIITLGKTLALLGGLVPLAIGLGLLTFYKLEK
ncbi:MAG: DUF6249 domain-containing protein [Spirochaetota bacterium]